MVRHYRASENAQKQHRDFYFKLNIRSICLIFMGTLLDEAGFRLEKKYGGHKKCGISSLLGINKFNENTM
jgi:hypothetical protein